MSFVCPRSAGRIFLLNPPGECRGAEGCRKHITRQSLEHGAHQLSVEGVVCIDKIDRAPVQRSVLLLRLRVELPNYNHPAEGLADWTEAAPLLRADSFALAEVAQACGTGEMPK